MDRRTLKLQSKACLNVAILFVLFTFLSGYPLRAAYRPIVQDAPVPLLAIGHPVDWWFVFKLNSKAFPECGGATRACQFGGTVQTYKSGFGQQFVFASSESGSLKQGSG